MFARLRGHASPFDEDAAIIDVGGVGYLVQSTPSELARMSAQGEVEVHVHTHVREDQITLFGFLDANLRLVFSRLITLHGVGPKLALSILDTLPLAALRDAALAGDTKALRRVPGCGPKTAQRLAIELGSVFAKLSIDLPTSKSPVAATARARDPRNDVLSALRNLGYTEANAAEALARAEEDGADASDFDGLLRRALAAFRKH